MRTRANRLHVSILIAALAGLLGGCETTGGFDFIKQGSSEYYKPVKTVSSYEEAGKWWGSRHAGLDKKNPRLQPGGIDPNFVSALADHGSLDFFWVHAELKDAFKKGYRLGYQERTADLVLGPNLTKAAELIGGTSADRFVKVVEDFESGWAETLKEAIDVFITLISEGSQADRLEFINNFEERYDKKYKNTLDRLKKGGFITQTSEGGTTLYIDATKTMAVLNIPSTKTLKTEIYRQTFRVMGDEWGKRLSHNLVKRDELVDLLRRSKTALMEVEPGMRHNLKIIQDAFKASYGPDGENVIRSMTKDAEL